MRRTLGVAALALALSPAAPARADLVYTFFAEGSRPTGDVILLTLPGSDAHTGFTIDPYGLPVGSEFSVDGTPWEVAESDGFGSSNGSRLDSGYVGLGEPTGVPYVYSRAAYLSFSRTPGLSSFAIMSGRSTEYFSLGDFVLTAAVTAAAVPEPSPFHLAAIGLVGAWVVAWVRRPRRPAGP
jgi:hypothetical protein